MPSDTTIGVSEESWRKLNARKRPGDGFDDVIRRLTGDIDGGDDEIPTLRDGELRASVSSMDTAEWALVPVDARQQLVAGRMAIDGFGDGPTDHREAIEYCADTLAESDSFSAPVSWQTEIVPGLSVEEFIHGFLAAAETSHLTDDVERDEF